MDNNMFLERASELKKMPDVVEIKDQEKFDSKLKELGEGLHIFTSDELTKKLENAGKDAIDSLGKDGSKIPSNIYNLALGNGLEKREKEIARLHGIDEWDGLDDLVARIETNAKKSTGKAQDDIFKEKEEKISDLKNRLEQAINEKDQAITQKEQEFSSQLNNMDLDRAVNELPIDADEDNLDNRRELVKTMFLAKHKMDRKEGRPAVYDSEGNLLKDKVGDPQNLSVIVENFASKWVNLKEGPDGGRGGSSTVNTNKKGYKGITTKEELMSYAAKNNIQEGTEEFLTLMQDVQKENPDIKL